MLVCVFASLLASYAFVSQMHLPWMPEELSLLI